MRQFTGNTAGHHGQGRQFCDAADLLCVPLCLGMEARVMGQLC